MISTDKVDALIQQMINIIDPEGAGPDYDWERLRDAVQRWAQPPATPASVDALHGDEVKS